MNYFQRTVLDNFLICLDIEDWMHQFNGDRPNLKFRAGTIKGEGKNNGVMMCNDFLLYSNYI